MVQLISSVLSSVIGIRGSSPGGALSAHGRGDGTAAPVDKPAPADRDPATSEHSDNRILESMLARFEAALKSALPGIQRDLESLFRLLGFGHDESRGFAEQLVGGPLGKSILATDFPGQLATAGATSFSLQITQLRIGVEAASGILAVDLRQVSINVASGVFTVRLDNHPGSRGASLIGGDGRSSATNGVAGGVLFEPGADHFAKLGQAEARALKFESLLVVRPNREAVGSGESRTVSELIIDLLTPIGVHGGPAANESGPAVGPGASDRFNLIA